MLHPNKKHLCILFVSVMLTSCIFLQAVTADGNIGRISDSSFYDSNTLYVVGEVKNTGDIAIQNVNVRVVFYDSSNQKITAVEGYTDLNVILVGRKSFFNIRMLESQGSLNVRNYTVWFNWTDSAAGKPQGLVVLSNNESVDSEGHKHVTGQIQNQGTVNSNNTEVSATFYNSSGTVVGASWAFSSPSNLSPGQTADFDIELIFTQQVAKVAGYSLTAESNSLAFSPNPTPSASSPSQTASASANPTPTTSTSASFTPTPSAPASFTPSSMPSPTPQSTQLATPSPTISNGPSQNPSSTPETTQASATPQNSIFAPTTNPPSETLSPSPITGSSTESPTTLIAIIAVCIIIILVALFIFYWKKGRFLKTRKSES